MNVLYHIFYTSGSVLKTTGEWCVQWWHSGKAPTMDETIDRLERVRLQVEAREQALRDKVDMHRAKALDFAKRHLKREARMQIRLRMLYDNQVVAVQRILTAIEGHLVCVQSASLNREVFLCLHDSSRALGSATTDDEFDKVDDVLSTLDDQHDQTRQIMDMISARPLDVSSLDEDDIDKELDSMLQSSDVDTNAAPASSSVQSIAFPEVPHTRAETGGQILADSI